MTSSRLYREIYRVSHSAFTGDTYTLINPVGITASTYIYDTVSGITTTYIETPIINSNTTGIFYIDLNNILYSYGNIYEAVWSVQYTNVSPIKNLPTLFRFNPTNISGQINLELIDKGPVYEIINNRIEILIGQ